MKRCFQSPDGEHHAMNVKSDQNRSVWCAHCNRIIEWSDTSNRFVLLKRRIKVIPDDFGDGNRKDN